MIVTDRETWDRWNETGEWVLFREEERWEHSSLHVTAPGPPAEFVEWAQPCETCEGRGFNMISLSSTSQEVAWCTNPDCHDGRRRIAVVVPCEHPDHENVKGGMWLCAIDGPPHTDDGLVSVGHVVVTWGPLVVRSPYDTDDNGWHQDHVVVRDYCIDVVRWTPHRTSERIPWTLPPDIDPQSMVGQYAIGGKVEQ